MHPVKQRFSLGLLAITALVAGACNAARDDRAAITLEMIADEPSPASLPQMLRAKFRLSNRTGRGILIPVTQASTPGHLIAAKPTFEVMRDDGSWISAFTGYGFIPKQHRVPAHSQCDFWVNLSRLSPVDGVVPLTLDDLQQQGKGQQPPFMARIRLGDFQSQPFLISDTQQHGNTYGHGIERAVVLAQP